MFNPLAKPGSASGFLLIPRCSFNVPKLLDIDNPLLYKADDVNQE